MHILISNDDGIYAPGIEVLANFLDKVAKVTVVAPDRNRSGASNSLTLDAPLRARWLDAGRASVEGTPTDCVHLANTGFLDQPADMVVSGINQGANVGDDTLYSGTVAAAIEGRALGLPAIAVSLVGSQCVHYETAGAVALQVVQRLIHYPLPSNTILNINVPDLPLDQLAGFEVTRLGARHRAEPTVTAKDPRGRSVYWIGLPGEGEDAGLGTDFYAIFHKKVSITPLQVDLTHHAAIDQLKGWAGGLHASDGQQ